MVADPQKTKKSPQKKGLCFRIEGTSFKNKELAPKIKSYGAFACYT